MLNLLPTLCGLKQTRRPSCLPALSAPAPRCRGKRGGGVGRRGPRSPPTPALAQVCTSMHANVCTSSPPYLLFLFISILTSPPPPFTISLCQALSLRVSFDLCPPSLLPSPSLSPVLSLGSVLPLRVPPSTALLLLPQSLCVRVCEQNYLLCCIFTVPFLCIDMFRYTNTYLCVIVA